MHKNTCYLALLIESAVIAFLLFVVFSNHKSLSPVSVAKSYSLTSLKNDSVENDSFIVDAEDDTEWAGKYWNVFTSTEHGFSIALLNGSDIIQNLFPKHTHAEYRFTKGAISKITLESKSNHLSYSDFKRHQLDNCSKEANRGREITPCILDEFKLDGEKAIIHASTGEPVAVIFGDQGIFTLYFAFNENQKINNDLATSYSTVDGIKRLFSLN